MLDIIENLTQRETIVYFFTKYTKNRLNKNCNDRKFFTKRNFGFVYDYIQNYFEEFEELKQSSITRKYYHILNWNADIKDEKKFINFREGYRGVSKVIYKNNKINFKSVMDLKIPFPYKKTYVIKTLEDDKKKNNKIKNMNNFIKFEDKVLLFSIFEYTKQFKKINLNYRISLLLKEIRESDLLCPICNQERNYVYNNLNISCEDKKCLKKIQTENAKKRGIWMMHTENAKLNRTNSLIGRKFSEEHKRKIGASNSKKWTPEFRNKIKLMKKDKNISERQSQTMKRKILSGEFTPKSENRKRSKRIKSDITGISYRSNWELIFHENNSHLKYEIIRIEYIEEGTTRVYITDFVDFDKNVIYEIKPASELSSSNFLNKKIYTEKWCIENGFTYEVITEKDYDFYGREKNKIK